MAAVRLKAGWFMVPSPARKAGPEPAGGGFVPASTKSPAKGHVAQAAPFAVSKDRPKEAPRF